MVVHYTSRCSWGVRCELEFLCERVHWWKTREGEGKGEEGAEGEEEEEEEEDGEEEEEADGEEGEGEEDEEEAREALNVPICQKNTITCGVLR